MRSLLKSVFVFFNLLPLALLSGCSSEPVAEPLIFREMYRGNISSIYGNVGPARLRSSDPSAPEFRWRDSTGALDSLSDEIGKVVVLTFFAEWCGPCHEEAPSFVSMSQKMKDSVEFIGIDVDANGDVFQHATSFANKYGIKYQVITDSAFRLYDAYIFNFDQFSLPYTLVVGRDGLIKNYHKGVANELVIQTLVHRADSLSR